MKIFKSVFQGTAFTSSSPEEIKILKDYLFCINEKGEIEDLISPKNKEYEEILKIYKNKENFFRLKEGQYILPGFVDLHVHAPQWAQAGLALDTPLYKWLNQYTFPLESKFSNLSFANKVYENLVDTLISNGTTTVLYFATIHKDSTLLLADICSKRGQRALIGKVVMDDKEQNPSYYRDDSTKKALVETEEVINRLNKLSKNIIQGIYPVVTPRFIPSCTDEALKGLGELASKYKTHIQSHCSESDWAHQYVMERFKKHDAFALNDFGLLTDKSIMAHCNFLDEDDALLFAKSGTAISHCPISNAYFSNSVIPISRMKKKGIEIGLGTDISGGFSPSIYDNIRQAIISSRMLEDGVNTDLPSEKRGVNSSKISFQEAFYFATAGGGESLKLPIGKLEKNYVWDIQIIDINKPESKLPVFDEKEKLYDLLQIILYLTRPLNIIEVWVQGKKIHNKK